MIRSKRKGGALYRRVSELSLSPKEGWRRIKWNLYAKVQRPEKWASSWEEGLSSLQEGDWAVAESQRGMAQDEVKIVCQGATPWKTGIFLRGRVELFTGGWVSCCWVPKRDDAGWSENCMPRCKKRASSWEEGFSSLPEGEWAVAESQRRMTQDEVKNLWRGATP